ncbi:cadmium resistance transporter [Rhizobium sp. P44RR-XXIV]|uniref:cadmium resistance transporter n=1 Tax=Rhizobium sp. P44RR-XXIV TaxID=1921145 RepID=UPI0009867BE6|nr:cadmium resistance transporter [Rhizobium sp. P44RR-XXIV]TIX91635.1 quaternary ammonium transporter [Rhizobium sp. P44RR-XXIV]
MGYLLGVLGVAIVVFTSTNVDDIFVLLGFFADPKFRAKQIIIGQYLGIATLYGVSVVASFLVLVIPAAYIGLLGFAPIYFGLRRLWELWNGIETDGDPEDHEKASAGHGNIAAVTLVTIANGGDNISVYTPLFATRSAYEILAIGCIFAVMTAIWLAAAHSLVNHPKLGAPIRKHGHRVVPFILICLGILILYEARTATLFWS